MELDAIFTDKAIEEAARMTRPWHQWPILIWRLIYLALIVTALSTAAIRTSLQQLQSPAPHWQEPVLLWLLVIALICYVIWTYRRQAAKQKQAILDIGTLNMIFDTGGIHTRQQSGWTTFEPWSSYTRFREGKHVLVLYHESKPMRTIPLEGAPGPVRDQLRGILNSCLDPNRQR